MQCCWSLWYDNKGSVIRLTTLSSITGQRANKSLGITNSKIIIFKDYNLLSRICWVVFGSKQPNFVNGSLKMYAPWQPTWLKVFLGQLYNRLTVLILMKSSRPYSTYITEFQESRQENYFRVYVSDLTIKFMLMGRSQGKSALLYGGQRFTHLLSSDTPWNESHLRDKNPLVQRYTS